MGQGDRSTQGLLDELVRIKGAQSPAEAIRLHARELIDLYVATLGEPELPLNMEVLASLRDIKRSDEGPVFSDDAELVPDDRGGVSMRVNPDRPETRQRFSIAHEITHTFFPGYTSKAWCRTDARFRSRANPDEHLEMLCDIGAAELLFPDPWFSQHASLVNDAAGMIELANLFHGSREATTRRFAELSNDPVAAVYFEWKLKPVQKGRIGAAGQTHMFGLSADDERRDAMRLRIEYSIDSPAFREMGLFLPKDKSVASEGPIYEASMTGEPRSGECHLTLGQATGTYRVWAVPLWTGQEQLGNNGENGVVAVIQPIAVKAVRRRTSGPGLFDR